MNSRVRYFSYAKSSRKTGLAIAALVHVLLVWGLLTGTAQRHVMALAKPLETLLIEDVALLPPPPAPKIPKSPPPTAPMPEIVAERSAPAIEVAVAPVVTPKADISPPVVSVPVAAPVAAVAPAKMEAALICPGQVRPEIPRKALIENIQGLVKAQAVVEGGHVKEVNILSGPRIFHEAVRAAMLQYQCASRPSTVVAMQEFNFRFE
jgi:protein TonB